MIKNARITSTVLGYDDGHLTFWLMLDYGGGGQGYGGYNLNGIPINTLGALLTTLGVRRWEQLPNTYIRVKVEDGLIRSVGHILNDSWFSM